MAEADTSGAQRAAHRLPLVWIVALGVFVIFILVLIFRPTGLLGHTA